MAGRDLHQQRWALSLHMPGQRVQWLARAYYITSNMTMTASFYRLDTTEADYDYYMAWERFQTSRKLDIETALE